MPDYPYQCTNPACGYQWWKFQNIKAKKLKRCPACGQLTAKRLIAQTSFVLKGDGWGKDGYR